MFQFLGGKTGRTVKMKNKGRASSYDVLSNDVLSKWHYLKVDGKPAVIERKGDVLNYRGNGTYFHTV